MEWNADSALHRWRGVWDRRHSWAKTALLLGQTETGRTWWMRGAARAAQNNRNRHLPGIIFTRQARPLTFPMEPHRNVTNRLVRPERLWFKKPCGNLTLPGGML
jgi:hypothetical protein